ARSKKLSEIFVPLFDIGQSTPALALFPFIVILVISILGGGSFSVEVASILLLLTGTQWYLLFNIVGAVKSIPGNILEASRAFDLKGIQFYSTVVLPAIIPGVLLGSIQAWGGAWNALIVSEYINYGGKIYSVPGLGSFLTQSTLAANPEPWVITLAVASMSLIVLLMNYFVWRPLFNYAEKFKFENV
ncbi:MAG: ABC transporter permease subunit, partial [Candidatus Anstonellaceae archaeon]